MTREVLITISGSQFADGDSDEIQMITTGDYFLKNGNHYILYDEVLEGKHDIVKNTIKIRPEGLDIIKRGSSNVHMVFEKDRKNLSCYATPFGEMMIGINTNDICIAEEEDRLNVRVAYSLDINYQHVSECSIVLDVHSKNTADLHLN